MKSRQMCSVDGIMPAQVEGLCMVHHVRSNMLDTDSDQRGIIHDHPVEDADDVVVGHEQITIHLSDGDFEVDAPLADLVRLLDEVGIPTMASCCDMGEWLGDQAELGWAYVAVDSAEVLTRAAAIFDAIGLDTARFRWAVWPEGPDLCGQFEFLAFDIPELVRRLRSVASSSRLAGHCR